MSDINIDDFRKKEDGRSYYKLVIGNKIQWLSVSQLEQHPLAKITRKAISLRISNFLSGRGSKEFKSIYDCISKEQMTKNRHSNELGDFDELNKLWNINK